MHWKGYFKSISILIITITISSLIKGDLRRTILQTFDCRESSYLKSFYKSLGDSNSTYGCAEPEVAADDSGNKSSQSYSYDSKYMILKKM